MKGRTVTIWDKDDLESLGYVKTDLLGLGMLTCIRKCFDLVRETEATTLTLDTVPLEDPAVYDMFCRGDTVGVFQIESRAQTGTLPRIQPRRFYDLASSTALIRPGPIQGGAVHPLIRRRQGREAVTYPHPEPRTGAEAILRHAPLSGAGTARGDGRRRVQRGGSGPPAPGDGQEAQCRGDGRAQGAVRQWRPRTRLRRRGDRDGLDDDPRLCHLTASRRATRSRSPS